ncbi:MAG: N-acetylmuramoyl-L-alanine amidase [Armatimonadota bacterium]
MKVALDAGHGAYGKYAYTGASANGLVEDYLALDIQIRIGHHLRKLGIKTLYTRPDNKYIQLGARSQKALAEKCNIFISLHFNAGPSAANGIEAYCALNDTKSRSLAESLITAIQNIGFNSRGVKWDSQSQYKRLKVLQDLKWKMPAVLLELGFLTNKKDAEMIGDKHFREKLAVLIANDILCWSQKNISR